LVKKMAEEVILNDIIWRANINNTFLEKNLGFELLSFCGENNMTKNKQVLVEKSKQKNKRDEKEGETIPQIAFVSLFRKNIG